MTELRWLQGSANTFSLDLTAFRKDLERPVLVDKFFCSPAIERPSLYIDGELIATGECKLADPDDVGAPEGEDDQKWFDMNFFANRPQLPLHLLAFTTVELRKQQPGPWPIMAYMTGPTLEPEFNPSSCFVPVKRLDGSWNVVLFRFGRAQLRSDEWVGDPKELESRVPGFKLSQDLAIA